MIELIRKLVESYGPSGNEAKVRELIADEVRDSVDDLRTDAMGNLLAITKGEGPTLMLAAHMDEIGLIITYIDEKGFLRFSAIGGLNPLLLPGHQVIFENGALGIIGWERRDSAREAIKIEKLYIDIGASDKASAKARVNVGDMAVLVSAFHEAGGRCVGKAMDDRVGCAVLVQLLKDKRAMKSNLVCAFTVQEEVGLRGAATSAYGVEPDAAIVVDVTTVGDTPEARPMAVSLGGGPAIKLKDHGLLAHPQVKNLLINTARDLGMQYQLEILEHGTTDASAIQVSRAGVPTGALSIPCRYVHSGIETIALSDVENAVKLLGELASKW